MSCLHPAFHRPLLLLMMRSTRALFAAVFLCVSSPVLADSHLSVDPVIKSARELATNGLFDAALDVLRSLPRDHPDQTDIRFLIGFAAIEASRLRVAEAERVALLDEAIAALRAILIDRPDLVRVRLELARAFFLKGDDGLARDHFERVLAGRPASAVAANIHRYLAEMRSRRRWIAYAGLSIAPDSNLSAASESEVIYINNLPFRRDGNAGATSGVGAILWGGGEYQYPLGERLRLRAGADVAQREYAGAEFDQTFVSLHAGPRWLVDADTEGSLLMSASRRWTAGRPQSHDLGGRLELTHRLAPRLTTRGYVSWHQRTYRESKHLDGPLLAFSASAMWVASPTVRVDAAVGYGRERPESVPWRNATRWARAGVSVALPLGFTLGGSGEMRWTRYRGSWFPYTPAEDIYRKDRTRILRVSLLNRAVTVFGFSPEIVLVNEARVSNAQLYDYRRNRAELRLQLQF